VSAVLPPLRADEVVVLGLGSNVGDRLVALQQAVDRLAAADKLRVDMVSSVYETEPVGGPQQDPFLNIAVRAWTRWSPSRLLRVCHEVEEALGRVRTERWGPRTIDVDILVFGMRTVDRRDLQIPHPRLAERPFALIPTIEVAPGMTFPDGTSFTSALARLAPVEGVTAVGSQVRVPAPA
jgi:2-amino-4-hydroxy-6-hydroxymethyldihydropteridine diphosphokinase